MKTNRSTFNLLAVTLITSICILGCSNKSASDAEFVKKANDTNIKKLATAYSLYASRKAYTGPKSKKELINFLKNNEKIERNLELIGLAREDAESIFVSENDGEEFKVRWGVFVNPDRLRAKEPIIFEKTGVDGVRLVMLTNKKILEVSDNATYDKMLKGKVNKEDAKTEEETAMEEEAATADL
jgi:hypothetical protein